MKMTEYRNAPGISASSLKWLRKSPAHFKAALDGVFKSEPTPAQIKGTMLHSLVLESRADYVVAPETYGDEAKPWNRNATFCKEWEAAQTKPVIKQNEAGRIELAASAVRNHPLASSLLTGGKVEESLFATCTRTGLKLKARPDYMGATHFVDLKTTEDASSRKFIRSAAGYDYEMQAAFYCYVAKLLCRPIAGFYFIALEIEPLPMVNVLLLSQHDLELATAKLMKELDAVADCFEAGEWPGYCANEATLINLPDWKWNEEMPEKLDMEN